MTFKSKIVIIGAGQFQNPLILKAKELGYETHVFAWRSGDIGEKTADYFYPISIVEKERILKTCRMIQPVAVVSIASDLAVQTVNYLARELGLNCNCKESDVITTNKYFMRKALKEQGIETPDFIRIGQMHQIHQIERMRMPLIIKPTDRSGSRGVYKVERREYVRQAVENACQESFAGECIVEEFIEGDEYSCECISFGGNHHVLAFTRKFTTGAPHYIERGHFESLNVLAGMQRTIKEEIFTALGALKISDSASHCEFKIDGDKVRIIEIGARMGGDFIGSHLVKYSTGYDFLRMVIDVARGQQPIIERIRQANPIMVRFLLNDEDKQILGKAREDMNVCVIEEVEEEENHNVVTDSSTRKGYFLMTAENTEYLKKYFP